MQMNSTGSGAAGVNAVSVGSPELLGQRDCLLCSKKMEADGLMGEKNTGREQTGEKTQGNRKIVVAAVQITHPKGLSNTAERQHNMMSHHLINAVTYLDN